MTVYIPQLDDAGVTAAAIASHQEWGGDRAVDDHVARALEAVRRGHEHVSHAGLMDDGHLVCALARHRLTLTTPDGPLEAIGLGAIFTPPTLRRRGYGRKLVERVMADPFHGDHEATLLFSNIDVGFYQALGFQTLSHVTWTARTEALPPRPTQLEPTQDIDRLLAIFEASWPTSWLRTRRTRESWAHRAWYHQSGDAFLVGSDDYVVARMLSDGTLWIDDAATTTIRAADLWSSLRTLASMLGAARVSGWLRPEHAGGPFVAIQRKTCIPMIASTRPLGDVRSHFASLDRF